MPLQSLTGTPVPSDNLFALQDIAHTSAVLLVLLAVLFALRWLLKKQRITRHTGRSGLQINDSLVVGQHEKIVVVALSDCQLVLGVTAQQITHLYTLTATEPPAAPVSPATDSQTFLLRLQTLLTHRGYRQ